MGKPSKSCKLAFSVCCGSENIVNETFILLLIFNFKINTYTLCIINIVRKTQKSVNNTAHCPVCHEHAWYTRIDRN